MSGTDPGLFGVAPESEPREKTEDPDSSELEASDVSLARELLDTKVGRIHVHPIERSESAGFSAVAYSAEAHRPPRPTEEYPTLPDAKVLVNVTQPLGGAPFPVVQTAPISVPRESAAREAPTDPGERRFAVVDQQRLMVPVRRGWAWWAAGLVLVAGIALWALRGSPVVPVASVPVAAVPLAPTQEPLAAPAPSALPSPPPVVATPPVTTPVRLSKPKAPSSTPRSAPIASAKAIPDPDLPPVKLLDEK